MDFDILVPISIVGMLIIGLPWIILHHMTQWRKARSLSIEDERLLDNLHDNARRLDDRLNSIERILTAENPRWRENAFPSTPDMKELPNVRSSH
jgi:phage shock protein B